MAEGSISIPQPPDLPFDIDTLEPSWQAIEQWIPADDDEARFHWQDMHHSNESHWKPRGVLLNEDRILVMDAK
jgi:hypothetical protein